jgi:hypothetical protein
MRVDSRGLSELIVSQLANKSGKEGFDEKID